MSLGPQYTSCVEAKDFTGLSEAVIVALAALILGGGIASLFTFGIGALVAVASLVQLLRYVLNFMLNGKLICLHRNVADCNCGGTGNTVCAIGEVADTEAVGEDKNPFEDIDNDYAMNLILAPFNMREVGLKGQANSAPPGRATPAATRRRPARRRAGARATAPRAPRSTEETPKEAMQPDAVEARAVVRTTDDRTSVRDGCRACRARPEPRTSVSPGLQIARPANVIVLQNAIFHPLD